MIAESPASSSTQVATITVLRDIVPVHPDDPVEPAVRFEAFVLRVDEPLMILQSETQIDLNAALKIETPEALWLGEVETCSREDPFWLLRIRLRHVVRDFETLARLAERFGSTAPRAVAIRI